MLNLPDFIDGSETGLRLAVRLVGLSAVKLSAAVGVRAQLQTLVESVLSYKHYNTL